MDAAANSHEIRIPVASLARGMFVARLDRPWESTPFPFQGFLIDDDRDLKALRKLCRWVAIDPAHSDPAALRGLGLTAEKTRAKGRARRPPEPRNTGQEPSCAKRKPPRRAREASGQLDLIPTDPFPEGERPDYVPAHVPLVRYRNEVAFDKEIDAADQAAVVAGDTLKALLSDMAEGGSLSLDDLRGSATDLALSVARNPDALQWMVRMRDSNAQVYMHGVKVAVYLMSFARHLGFAPAELVQMATIGLLLDVGKIYVDQDLLLRRGGLDGAERARIEQHVTVGVEKLAEEGSLPAAVLAGIHEHHERVDGQGYPRQLPAEAISIHGRMAAIADCFAAMTSPRPYAATMAPHEAMKLLYAEAGSKFHAPLVEQFVQAVGIFPTGALVELSTGEIAVVVCHNRVRRLEPRVLVVMDAARRALEQPYEIDLMTQPHNGLGEKPIRIERGLPDGAYGLNLAALYAD